jgi:hypothetical protein
MVHYRFRARVDHVIARPQELADTAETRRGGEVNHSLSKSSPDSGTSRPPINYELL